MSQPEWEVQHCRSCNAEAENMPAHKHAALIMKYAELAQGHERPWEFFEHKYEGKVWHQCANGIHFLEEFEYRLKPTTRTVTINGKEFELPEGITREYLNNLIEKGQTIRKELEDMLKALNVYL